MGVCGCLCGDADAYDLALPGWMVWSDHPIRQQFDVVMDIGEGSFAQVVLGRHKQDHAKFAALKVVFLRNPELDEEHLEIMRKEAEFLLMLNHDSIVQCYDVIDNGKQMVLVMEFLRGGPLLDDLHHVAGESYTEQQASIIFGQILEAVAYMHERGIMHRDVKPENIMFAQSVETSRDNPTSDQVFNVKIIDLGMSARYDPKVPLRGALGSPGFISPEIIIGEPHSYAMDVFAVGVVLFVLLVGRKPFNIADSESLSYCHMDLESCPGMQDSRWKALSPEAQGLVLGLLDYNPATRLTAQQALQQEWMVTKGGVMPRPLAADVPRGAANVAAARRLRNMVHGTVAMDTGSQDGSQRGPQENMAEYRRRHTAEGVRGEQSRGYRGDNTGRGLTRVDSLALKANAASVARMHDTGRTMDPSRDISHHYRPHRGYSGSYHGGNIYNTMGDSMHSQESGGSGKAKKSGRKGMPRNYSTPGLARTDSTGGGGSQRGQRGPQPWRNLGVSLKDYMDSSVRGGKVYSGADSSARSGRQFYNDASARGGKVYNDSSARSGKVYNESSARGGKVYNERSTRAGTVWDDSSAKPPIGGSADMQNSSGNGMNGSFYPGQRTMLPSIPSFNHRGQTSADFAADRNGPSLDFGTSSKRVHKIAPL